MEKGSERNHHALGEVGEKVIGRIVAAVDTLLSFAFNSMLHYCKTLPHIKRTAEAALLDDILSVYRDLSYIDYR